MEFAEIFQNNLLIGYILTWEKYGFGEKINYNKGGQQYGKQIGYESEGFFNIIYLGLLF